MTGLGSSLERYNAGNDGGGTGEAILSEYGKPNNRVERQGLTAVAPITTSAEPAKALAKAGEIDRLIRAAQPKSLNDALMEPIMYFVYMIVYNAF